MAVTRCLGAGALMCASALVLSGCDSDGGTADAAGSGVTDARPVDAPAPSANASGEPSNDARGAAADGGPDGEQGFTGRQDSGGPQKTPPPKAPDSDHFAADRSHYSATEQAFFDQIDANGVTYPTLLAAADAGNVTCEFFQREEPYSTVVGYVQSNLGTDAGDTGAVARAAVDNLCPDQEQYADEAEARFRMGEE